jgi:hypothetical protein
MASPKQLPVESYRVKKISSHLRVGSPTRELSGEKMYLDISSWKQLQSLTYFVGFVLVLQSCF